MKEKIVDFYDQYKLFIFPGVVTLCSAILIVFVIFPQLMSYLDSRTAYQTIVSRKEVLDVKAQNLENIDEVEVKKNVDIVLNVLPAEKDYPKVIGMVREVTSKYLFTLVSLQFGSVPDPSKQQTSAFLVNIEVTGSKTSLPLLLKELENTVPLSKVESIDMSSKPGESTINANITLNVFYSDIPKSLGSVDAPIPQISDEERSLISKYSSLVQADSAGVTPTVILSPRGKPNPFE